MAHNLFNLTQSLYNTPHLITSSSMSIIMDYLESRNTDLYVQPPKTKSETQPEDADSEFKDLFDYFPEAKVGIIPITGVLTSIPFQGLCGIQGVSYTSLLSNFNSLIKAGAKTIVLDIDSGGGSAFFCFEAALEARQMADDANIKIITYVDGIAASAAYAWASIADEVISNPMSEVGSIGVVTKLVNTNRMDKEDGIDITYLYAGDSKIPFDAEGDFRPDFLADIQTKIDAVYDSFVSLVSQNRNMSLEDIKATQAKTFLAPQALENGLIDKVMTKKQFTTYLFGN